MKVGRNDPCPCGSGRKYKKCCYLKKESNESSQNIQNDYDEYDEYDDEPYQEQEFMLDFMVGLRRLTLDRKPYIKEYYKIRKLHSDIINAMVRYHEDGKFEHKMDDDNMLPSINNETLHFIGSNFDLGTRVGAQGLYDILIYKSMINMNCITEDFIEKHRYRKPEKVEFLHSMLDSKTGLFEVTGTDMAEGYVYLKEVFTDAEYKVTDVAQSGRQSSTEFYFYTRLITYRGICFNTGLNIIFNKSDDFIQSHIKHHKKKYSSEGEFLRFTQLYNHYSQNPDSVRIVTNTLK